MRSNGESLKAPWNPKTVYINQICCAAQGQDRFRWNLLKAFPWLRTFLRSEWWPEKINFQ